jgi:hypothetical protein
MAPLLRGTMLTNAKPVQYQRTPHRSKMRIIAWDHRGAGSAQGWVGGLRAYSPTSASLLNPRRTALLKERGDPFFRLLRRPPGDKRVNRGANVRVAITICKIRQKRLASRDRSGCGG